MVNVETKEGGGEEKVAIKHYIFQISEKNKVFHAMKIVNEMIFETECECWYLKIKTCWQNVEKHSQ